MAEFRGTSNADILRGGDAADTLYGSGGSDVLYGGAGADVLYAGDGVATDGKLGVGGTSGEAGTTNFLYGEDGNDILYGDAGKDTLDGGAGDDTLYGSTGDTLLGGDGADKLVPLGYGTQMILDGGAGDDVIGAFVGIGDGNRATGGAGADSFQITFSTNWSTLGYTVITDFNAAEGDRLAVGSPINAVQLFRGTLDNANFTLTIGDTFSSRDYGSDVAQVWTWGSGGDTYIIVDRDASRTLSADDIVVRLTGQPALSMAAFTPGSLSTVAGTDAADIYVSTKIGDTYYGLAGNDVIRGSDGSDQLHGGPGDDQIYAGGGGDRIWGGDGDDLIDGGGGLPVLGYDTAIYSGASTDYLITRAVDGSVRVQDLHGHDGLDTLINIPRLQFTDKTVATSYVFSIGIETAFKSVLRASSEAPSQMATVLALSDSVVNGATYNQIIARVIKAAGATISVASLAYEFFTGKVPGEAGIDYLVSPTGPNANNLNGVYYQSFNLENRYINFAVNLGKLGEGKDAFQAKYGSLSLFDATREAYKAIFGAAPTDAKIHALIDTRTDYFAAYGGDGANGIGTKAAMVGWLLAEAQKADLGVMVKSNDAWLTDLADGSAPFAIDILDPAKGYYKADFVFGGS